MSPARGISAAGPLRVGVGINSWNDQLGDMGSRARRACAVIDGPVNVASRLVGRRKYHGVGTPAGPVLWKETLRASRAHRWEQVEASLQQLQRMDPSYEINRCYAGRVAEFRRSPSPDARDGVTAFDEK